MWTLVLLAILAAPQCGPSYQSSHIVYLSDQLNGGYGCDYYADTVPGLRQFYVLMSTTGAGSVEFSAPLPSCIEGATYLSDDCPYPVHIGNSQTGVAVAFSSCKTGDAVHVLTINCWMAGQTKSCCPWRILPSPTAYPSNQIGVADCDLNYATAYGGMLLVQKSGVTADHPLPPDGATNQPLSVRLTWMEHYCDCSMCPTSSSDIYFGTTTDPPLVYSDEGSQEGPYDPGLLQPYTTYYWKIRKRGLGDPWTSPLWSFTTTSSIDVESTSWGAIKALYSD